MTVAENLAYPLKLQGVPRRDRKAKVAEALAAARLETLAGQRPESLSGLHRQRVSLARVLILKPDFLILDDPMGRLEDRVRGEFRDEDRLCAARIARELVESGHEVADRFTAEVLERWGQAPDDAFLRGRSAKYLRDTAQEHDLEFVLGHIEDLSSVYALTDGEVRKLATA